MTATMPGSLPDHVKIHPAAEIFPMMAPDRFAELVQDIKENGLLESLTTDQDGALIDGRNRYLACAEAGVEPRYATYKGDPWRYVISANLHRRHLTDTQRAMVAGRLAARLPGRPSEKASYDSITEASPTRRDAADLLQVSQVAVQRARRVQAKGSEALNKMTEEGRVPLYTAVRVADLDADEQETFVQRIDRGIAPSQAVPTKTPPVETPAPPAVTAKRRPRPTDARVISADALDRIAVDMAGFDVALKQIEAVDPQATADERAAWVRSMTKGIQALTRIRRLIKDTVDN
ncbi:hypothetical protein [Amycolatopsis sp. NPDC004079]|uniref:hypothetical protein n=1 Tax=Amycolatopsis sp. NPDC004079 TaxID=3154549 RepID=UPI0033BAF2B9